jgi:hypothetical protein
VGPLERVPVVDCLGLLSEDGGLRLCLVNRDLEEDCRLAIDVAGAQGPWRGRRRLFDSDEPMAQHRWGRQAPVFRASEEAFRVTEPRVEALLPKHSFLFLELEPDK